MPTIRASSQSTSRCCAGAGSPISVADLAADLDLPLGVVRILIADLRERGLVAVHHPVPMRLTDPKLLREVADGLRRL